MNMSLHAILAYLQLVSPGMALTSLLWMIGCIVFIRWLAHEVEEMQQEARKEAKRDDRSHR